MQRREHITPYALVYEPDFYTQWIQKEGRFILQDGKYKQAEEMHRQALQLMEAVLGKEYPSTLLTMTSRRCRQSRIELVHPVHQNWS
jgi:hypothetical protein